MERMYYIKERRGKCFLLLTASYGFSSDEEIRSALEEIYCTEDLLVGHYVHFEDAKILDLGDRLFINGPFTLYSNELKDEDREEYDREFDLSVQAFLNDDKEGIDRWNDYLKSYEEKFFAFQEVRVS